MLVLFLLMLRKLSVQYNNGNFRKTTENGWKAGNVCKNSMLCRLQLASLSRTNKLCKLLSVIEKI